MQAEVRDPTSGRARARRVAGVALRVAVATVALVVLAHEGRSLLALPPALAGPRIQPQWVVLAAVAAVGSILAYGELHRQLLRRGGAHLPAGTVQAITLAGNAMTATLPAAGSATSTVYCVQSFRRRGAPTSLATATVITADATATAVLLVAAPALLAVAGVLHTATGIALSLAALGLVAGTVTAARSPTVLARFTQILVPVAMRVPGLRRRAFARTDPTGIAREVATWPGRFLPGPRTGPILAMTSVLGYGLDFLALAASTRAVLPEVPWPALCAGWLAGQIGVAVQLTPGGAGLVEAGLGGALLATNVGLLPVAMIVAVYRGLTWIGLATLGWAVFLALGRSRHRPAHRAGPRDGGSAPRALRGDGHPS